MRARALAVVVFPTPPFWLERTMVLAISKVTSVCCVVWCGNNLYMVIMRVFSVYLGVRGQEKVVGGTPKAQMQREKPHLNHIIL